MELLHEWHEFLGALKRHGVRFLLVGAHALAAHGRPRFTQDLDVLVEPTPANARRVAAAIAEFAGFTWGTATSDSDQAPSFTQDARVRSCPATSHGTGFFH